MKLFADDDMARITGAVQYAIDQANTAIERTGYETGQVERWYDIRCTLRCAEECLLDGREHNGEVPE